MKQNSTAKILEYFYKFYFFTEIEESIKKTVAYVIMSLCTFIWGCILTLIIFLTIKSFIKFKQLSSNIFKYYL